MTCTPVEKKQRQMNPPRKTPMRTPMRFYRTQGCEIHRDVSDTSLTKSTENSDSSFFSILDDEGEDSTSGLLETRSVCPTRRVSFGTVSIQEHKLILGDNPYCNGYPITLDWKHTEPRVVDVNDHADSNEHGRDPLQPLDAKDRLQRLQQMGYTRHDILTQERKRRILLTEEWAYGDNKEVQPIMGMPTTKILLNRYVIR